jgi:hypothetical protein
MIFEIEDYNGNTLCAFMIPDELFNKQAVEKPENMFSRTTECSIADINYDYIFDTEQKLVRIQLETIRTK